MKQRQLRRDKIQGIRKQLRQIKVVSTNRIQIEAKVEKNRLRRQSLQFADTLQSQKLLRKYSDQDQDEDRNNLNTFNEKYILMELIGEGANARVHKCEFKESKKIYAVKIISMDQEHILQLKKNFINIKQIRHSSIIKYRALYFDFKKHVAYLVQEYFPFPDLSQQKILDEVQLKHIFAELLQAIAYIHQRNICHRDIKPENILYDGQSKTIKLIDFGISKKTFQRGSRRDMLTIIGTSLFLAPQVLLGGGYDQRVDIWSAGVTLYKIITGVTPFESEYHSQTINRIIKGAYTFDQEIWKSYSYFAKDFIFRLLKPKDQRLTIKQASRHLWFDSQFRSSSMRQRRSSLGDDFRLIPKDDTFCIRMIQAFYQGQLKLKNATSKEQGQASFSPEINESKKKAIVCQKLNLIENKQFDLQDSQEEEDRSPSTVTSKGQTRQ